MNDNNKDIKKDSVLVQIGKGLLCVVIAIGASLLAAALCYSKLPSIISTILGCIIIGVAFSFVSRLVLSDSTDKNRDNIEDNSGK